MDKGEAISGWQRGEIKEDGTFTPGGAGWRMVAYAYAGCRVDPPTGEGGIALCI